MSGGEERVLHVLGQRPAVILGAGLLAATSLGLGTCWCGVLPIESRVAAVRGTLGIPETHVPLALIAVGYPAEHKDPRVNFKPSKVHWESW